MNNYIDGVARVSNIVEYKYPFSIEDKTRFLEWLYFKWITEEDYMNTATSWWTAVHNNLENYILGHNIENNNPHIQNEIIFWRWYIDKLKEDFPNTEWKPEFFLLDEFNRFQWTCDLVRINGNKVFLYDYKTYEICKKKFWLSTKLLKSWTPWKPTDKIKKVSLQLSLYAQYFIQKWYEIWWIYLVWLHNSWVHEYKCDLWSKEEIDKLLINFLTKDIDMDNIELEIKSPFKIRLQSAPVAYSAIEVTLDLKDLDNWLTAKEAINEAVALHKRLHNCYIPKESKDD